MVDLGDHVALVDMLVVGDRNRRDVARDLGRDRELARRDEGVVGRFEMRGLIPVEVSGRRRQQERDQADRRQDRMATEEAFARLVVGFLLFRGRLLAGFSLALGGLCRALGLLGGLRRVVNFGGFDRTFGRRLFRLPERLGRRSAQGDNVPLGARCAPRTRGRDLVPIGFGRWRVLVHLLALVLIPARHGRNSPGGPRP